MRRQDGQPQAAGAVALRGIVVARSHFSGHSGPAQVGLSRLVFGALGRIAATVVSGREGCPDARIASGVAGLRPSGLQSEATVSAMGRASKTGENRV